ncbi:MAG TPA: chloride channel protein, partial [Nitriliruptorales bacterium]
MSVVDTPTRAASRLHDRVRELRTRLSAYGRSEPLLMLLGAVIGVLTGLLAWVLVEAVFGAQDVAFGNDPGWARVVLVPAAGGLVVGLLAWLWSSEPSGGGIATVLRAVAVRGGRLRARVPAAVVAESGLALGTGSSGGREAPIILGGGAVGSLVGQLFSLNEDRMRTMVAAGAAAGIGASFNAPIGGMLFAIELILGQLRAGSLQVVVVASVAGSVTARELVGPELVFAPDTVYSLNDPRELAVYALLGVLAVGVGLAFHRGEQLGQALFRRVRIWPPLRVALGGLVVGGMALAVPEVLGSGHAGPPVGGVSEPILTMIEGGFGDGWDGVRIVAVLLVAKLVATLISVTTGSAVGTLLPTLFTGAALGAAVGKTLVILLPDAGIQPGAFALVGMAAVFAAAARTPLTAVLIVFELTGDYGLVLPLMLSAGLATFIADRIEPDGIYTAPLRREGIVTHEPDEVDVMQSITVGEVMTTSSPQLDASLPLEDVIRAFRKTAHHGFAVVD